jgi:enamine deaminase RidA (YjgF/YER057c/UK114 family)
MDQAHIAAREIALSVLSNLKHEIGELSHITGWGRVFGMVNSTPDFDEQHLVINGFSDLIIDIFGKNIGNHARSAIGVAGLPMNFAIEIEGELEIQ